MEIKTYKPIEKQKEFSGVLRAFDQDTVTIEMQTGEMKFDRSDVALIRLALDF